MKRNRFLALFAAASIAFAVAVGASVVAPYQAAAAAPAAITNSAVNPAAPAAVQADVVNPVSAVNPAPVQADVVVQPNWVQPTISSNNCTGDGIDNVHNWTVNLANEDAINNGPNYAMQWADNSGFNNLHNVTMHKGANALPTPASVTTLYIGWKLDPTSNAHATWNGGVCPVHHTVTHDPNSCTDGGGWSAWYKIDNGPEIPYANGTWPKPAYVPATVNVGAYTIPNLVPGDTYNITQIPAFTITESASCLQKLDHVRSLTGSADCIGWSFTANSSDGGVFVPAGPMSGAWGDLYAPESASISGTWTWSDGYSVSDKPTVVDKPANCVQKHSPSPSSTSPKSTTTPPPTAVASSGSSPDNGIPPWIPLGICLLATGLVFLVIQNHQRQMVHR